MLYTCKGGTVCPKGFRALLGREIVIHEICNTKEYDICKYTLEYITNKFIFHVIDSKISGISCGPIWKGFFVQFLGVPCQATRRDQRKPPRSQCCGASTASASARPDLVGPGVTQDDSDEASFGSGPRGLLDLPHFIWGEKTSKFRGKFLEGMCCFSNMLLLFLGWNGLRKGEQKTWYQMQMDVYRFRKDLMRLWWRIKLKMCK